MITCSQCKYLKHLGSNISTDYNCENDKTGSLLFYRKKTTEIMGCIYAEKRGEEIGEKERETPSLY